MTDWSEHNRRNEKTAVGQGPWLLSAPPSFEEAFKRHYRTLKTAAESCDGSAYLVAATRRADPQLQLCVLSASGDARVGDALVVGRHSRCALCLADDESAALRHALIRLMPDSGQRPALRVTDLNTGQGFFVEGLGLCRAVIADGPAFISIGAYGVMLLPSAAAGGLWPEDGGDAWRALPSRHVVGEPHMQDAEPQCVRAGVHAEGEAALGSLITSITVVPAPARPRQLGSGASLPQQSYAVIAVREQLRETYFAVTAAELEAGVLLGRYSRCAVDIHDREARVSRVHLVLLKEGDRVFAIDAASTNGTVIDRAPRSLAELADNSTLELGKGCVVRWERCRRRAA